MIVTIILALLALGFVYLVFRNAFVNPRLAAFAGILCFYSLILAMNHGYGSGAGAQTWDLEALVLGLGIAAYAWYYFKTAVAD